VKTILQLLPLHRGKKRLKKNPNLAGSVSANGESHETTDSMTILKN